MTGRRNSAGIYFLGMIGELNAKPAHYFIELNASQLRQFDQSSQTVGVRQFEPVKAATQVRDASFEATRLRALSTVISATGHNIARDMEQGLVLRY
jgi:hypothetical protein